MHERREKSSSYSLMNPSNLPAVAPSLQVPSEASKRLLPWLVAFAFFMESLDTTILNTAVPAVSAALHVTPLSMKAVLASYTLSLAVFIPISGWVADRFGTRRVFAAAIGLFTLGSFLCGISSNIDALVACRILQGMGGSMMAGHELLHHFGRVVSPAGIRPSDCMRPPQHGQMSSACPVSCRYRSR